MEKTILIPIKVILFCFLLFFQLACTKDSDLLADYVISEDIVGVDKLNSSGQNTNNSENSDSNATPTSDSSSNATFKQVNGPLKAFPSAYGGGSNASGGRGLALAIITTLDPNAPLEYFPASNTQDEYFAGGFYAALQNEKVGYIVFNVSGNIDLGVGGVMNKFEFGGIPKVNNKTVFGQSAPEGGITLTGGAFKLNARYGDNQNIIIRYLRSRPIYNRNGVLDTSDDAATWGFLFFGGKNIVLDHCSSSFAQDKAIGAYINSHHVPDHPMTNLTFSNNLIGDSHTGLYVEINPGREGNPENYVDLISFYNNVVVGVNRTPNLAFNGYAEKINNVLHDTPFKQTSAYFNLKLNHVGNYYSNSRAKNRIRTDQPGNPLIYTSENYFEGELSGDELNSYKTWVLSNNEQVPDNSYFSQTPFNVFPNPKSPDNPKAVFQKLVVEGDVGAYKYIDNQGNVKIYRDTFDSSQLSIVKSNQDYEILNPNRWVIPNIPHSVRPENYDTDNDGMSDAWELKYFGSLNESYRGDYDGDGYTNIEEYMNQVDFD